ncbi:MAG: PilZ domain-containing protein [Nitrospirae bacterium]|nr:PilZ domain-containing protein [Nitrospirota bacterium]
MRISITKDVTINKTTKAEGLDLSEEGMYLYTTKTFITGNIIHIKFRLGNETLNLTAKVQHSQAGIGIGVNFTDLDRETLKKIKNYISIKSQLLQKDFRGEKS